MGALKRRLEAELEATTGDPVIRLNSKAYKAVAQRFRDEIADKRGNYRQLQSRGARQTYAATVKKPTPDIAVTRNITAEQLTKELDNLNDALGLGNY